jgi:spore coat polysaccharide biosynthesis protein SpsF
MKIGALIPIRMSSERFPGKALANICGRPMCYHLFDRVAASSFILDPLEIVVCTTDHPSDDILVQVALDYGVSVFRGDRNDIIKRLNDAIKKFGFDAVIQVDGDDPLSSTEYMDKTMSVLQADSSIDIVTVSGLPLGCAVKSFTAIGMSKVYSRYKTANNDTGFIYFFTKTGFCNHLDIKCENPNHMHENARLTFDYPADFFVINSIITALYQNQKVPSLSEVVEFLHLNPKVVAHNQSVDEEYWQRTAEKAQLLYLDDDGNERIIVL